MEKIKVNMSPNPLDVQTIHASQNDGEARQWEFELHNNGELIDTSDVKEQLVFKAYKGGTEQLLPENTSTPTTSPFKGDIKYPDATRTDQEFLYRESPTEKDGNAKIETIYGNTLKWNQLVQNGNFESTSGWSFNNCSGSASNNVCTISVTAGTKGVNFGLSSANAVKKVVGHKYLFAFNVKVSVLKTNNMRLNLGGSVYVDIPLTANVDTRYSTIFSATETSTRLFVYPWGSSPVELTGNETVNVHDYMFIDLTAMFGNTKADEIYAMEQAQSGSGIAYFRSLYPLPFYQYDSGSLLPFRVEGLKTVGRNLLMPTATFPQTINGVTYTLNADGSITANGTAGSGGSILIYWDKNTYGGKLLADDTYKLSGIIGGSASTYSIRTNGFGGISITGGEATFTITDSLPQTNVIIVISNGVTVNNVVFKPMIRRANVADNTYQKYFSSTLSLSISTYFPNGMKSAENVYDELTPTKAVTRIGAVDLGSLNWSFVSSSQWNCFTATVPDKANGEFNLVNSKYTVSSVYGTTDEKIICGNRSNKVIYVRDSSYTDATAFKTAMNGVMLYYELATPTETSFTTASLATENAEIPLSNEDGVLIGKCTEELSAEPGFHDAKIKLADGDGECYSNKIQLHIERSPQ